MKKLLKKFLTAMIISLICGCFMHTHRRMIHAWLNGEPMPKAPKWHCWVKPENRRS